MESPRGVVAAGHPLTAEAGAQALREGGNAVDAAVAAVLASFALESPLTGFGAGGFMLVHTGEEDVLVDFFVAAPGREGIERRAELLPAEVLFDDTPQIFNIGPASCGVPGTAPGLAAALERFGSMPLSALVKPAVHYARAGAVVNAQQAYIFEILVPVLTEYPETRALYAPQGRMLREGETFRFPELADALERFAAEGPQPFCDGDIGRRIAAWVSDRGGTLGPTDMASYEAVFRDPVRVGFRGREVLTNPPPSSGGILIALCLDLLERVGDTGVEAVVAAMQEANEARVGEFHEGLYDERYVEQFLAEERLAEVAKRALAGIRGPGPAAPGDVIGSTTHLVAIDGEGCCASVTCSNGTGSGILVPGTGVHVNNMLGEEDLNPLGFHRTEPGRRMTSMMAPTLVLRGGDIEVGMGSAGSNRIRSAILQVVLRLIADGMPVQEAIDAGRVHFEQDVVQAEPGVDEEGLRALEARGYQVARWKRRNLFFGGVQAVARDPEGGALSGGGDPRRGGAAVSV